MRFSFLFAVPVLAGFAAAQTQTIVSPIATATAEGNISNSFPISSSTSRRYQQIHSDLGAGPFSFNKLSFRPGGRTSPVTYSGTRALDCEMYMGFGVDYAAISEVFDANYIGGKTKVITRKTINLPAIGTISTTPANFVVDLVLDTPFTFGGAGQSLIWELVVYSNTVSGGWTSMDAHRGSFIRGSTTTVGVGCVATGRPLPFRANAVVGDMGGSALFGINASKGPANSPAVVALGATNPMTSVPGLCGDLYTDLLAIVPAGTTSSSGRLPYSSGFAIWAPNVFGGQTIYAQMHALDTGRSDPFKVTNSNGVSGTFPQPGAGPVKVSRMFNNTGGVTATTGVNTSTNGYGLVTQFTY